MAKLTTSARRNHVTEQRERACEEAQYQMN
jgi:hypothetical protein